jgi:hypothetical protein
MFTVFHGRSLFLIIGSLSSCGRNSRAGPIHSAFPLGPQDVAANTAGEPRDLTTAAAMVIEAARFKINGVVGARDAAKNQAAAYDRQAVELHQQVEALVKTRNR